MQTKNKTFYKTFGEALKDVLKQRPKPINQSWLGEKSGKGKSEVSLYTNNKKMAGKETRVMFGDLLGVEFKLHGSGYWEVVESNSVSQAIESTSQLKESQSHDKAHTPTRDEIQRQLELAESLIHNCRELLKKR